MFQSDSLTVPKPKIAELCLNVIGAYVAWIDIGLIANDRFVPLIIRALLDEETQEAAADCVCSILVRLDCSPILHRSLKACLFSVKGHGTVAEAETRGGLR